MRGIYKITHEASGRYYLGSSCDVEKRWRAHRNALRRGAHHSLFLQRAWDKYGEDAFSFLVVEHVAPSADLRLREQEYLDAIRNIEDAFNVSQSASGGDLLSAHPNREAIILRMTSTLRERYAAMSADERRRLFGRSGEDNPNYGNRWSASQRRRLAKQRMGKPLSEETKKKLSSVHRARWTDEMREEKRRAMLGRRNHFYGKKHTLEARKAMSRANKGRTPTNARPVRVGDAIYHSVSEAARHLGVVPATLLYRIRTASPLFEDYAYVS